MLHSMHSNPSWCHQEGKVWYLIWVLYYGRDPGFLWCIWYPKGRVLPTALWKELTAFPNGTVNMLTALVYRAWYKWRIFVKCLGTCAQNRAIQHLQVCAPLKSTLIESHGLMSARKYGYPWKWNRKILHILQDTRKLRMCWPKASSDDTILQCKQNMSCIWSSTYKVAQNC